MAEYPRVPDPPAPDPAQARINDLRALLVDCIGAMRTVQPHLTSSPPWKDGDSHRYAGEASG